jgi:hypothetical protein
MRTGCQKMWLIWPGKLKQPTKRRIKWEDVLCRKGGGQYGCKWLERALRPADVSDLGRICLAGGA